MVLHFEGLENRDLVLSRLGKKRSKLHFSVILLNCAMKAFHKFMGLYYSQSHDNNKTNVHYLDPISTAALYKPKNGINNSTLASQ